MCGYTQLGTAGSPLGARYMTPRDQISLPPPPPLADSATPRVSARMVNERAYCPRLAYAVEEVRHSTYHGWDRTRSFPILARL